MSINGMLSPHGILRHLGANLRSQSSAMEKLSSGLRINTAADDPSGLTLSEQLRAQINGLERAIQNTSEADNVLLIMDGALGTMQSVLTTMRKLAVAAANTGVINPERISALQAEMDASLHSISRIVDTTNVAGRKLLDQLQEEGKLRLGATAGEQKEEDAPTENAGGANAGSRWASEFLRNSPANQADAADAADGSGENATLFLTPGGDDPDAAPALASPDAEGDGDPDEPLEIQIRKLDERDKALFDLGNRFGNFGMSSLGSITAPGKGWRPVTLTLDDLYSGGAASLFNDPVMAMRIVEQAGKDVATQRASIGAALSLSANNRAAMEAQLENTTRLESGIRDTEYARTMTEYARAQVLSQAGFKMLDAVMRQNESIVQLLA